MACFEGRIHKGAKEIGVNCIEVAENDDLIVLDIGRLPSAWMR